MQQPRGTPQGKQRHVWVKVCLHVEERTSAMLMFLSRSTTYLPSGCTFTSTLFFPITCMAESWVSSAAKQSLWPASTQQGTSRHWSPPNWGMLR